MGIKILILNWSSLLIFKFSKKMARRVPKAVAYRFFMVMMVSTKILVVGM